MKKAAFKFFALLLVFSALFSLAACGEKAELPEPAESAEPEVSPETGAEPEPTLPPLPDIDINSWEFAVTNSYNSISEYEPPFGSFEGQGVDARIVEPLTNFFAAARDAGYDVYSAVSYRNYEHLTVKYQKMIYAGNDAATIAQTFLAPGLNDHQTGLSFDLTTDANESINYGDFYQENIEETDAYKWMVEHCQDYGFILRYPEDKAEYYGTPCRNAHFRYVGEEAAKYIMENDLCLEEFIRLYDEKAVFVPAIDVEK